MCDRPPVVYDCPGADTVWLKKDSIIYQDTGYVPDPIYIDTGSTNVVYKWKELEVDSLAVFMAYGDYYTIRIYDEYILKDSNGFVRIIDSVYMNKIQFRTVKKEFYPSYIHVTHNIPYEPVNKFYIGGGIGGYTDNFGLSVKAMFINKKDNAVALSYDPINKYIEASFYYKIKLFNKN